MATIRKLAAELGLTLDHFDEGGDGWRAPRADPIPLAEILVEGSSYNRGRLKHRLYTEGLKERRCELCGQDECGTEGKCR